MLYLFFLGNHPDISEAEIKMVCNNMVDDATYTREQKHLFLETEQSLAIEKLMDTLGGTIKIAERIAPSATDQDIITYLLSNTPEGKIVFSLNESEKKGKHGIDLKKQLKEHDRSIRYVEPKNTATILHNNLVGKKTDLTIYQDQLFATVGIQPIESLSSRDYDRPGRDSKSGMLPPKLAKMLINLSNIHTEDTILDPFCGSGTILMEAASMEYTNLTGTDTSQKAVDDSIKNMEWLEKKSVSAKAAPDKPVSTIEDINIFKANAEHINKEIAKESIDAVITEPYMGVPLRGHENKPFLQNQAKELSLLYTHTFRSLYDILAPNGTVVFIMPQFRHDNTWVIINCIDRIVEAGFSVEPLTEKSKSLLYWRSGQFVGRMIWKFKKV